MIDAPLRLLETLREREVLRRATRSLGANSQDANVIRVLAGRHVDDNVMARLGDESRWILHDPCRPPVIAHQDHALCEPFGMTNASATAEALRDTRFVP